MQIELNRQELLLVADAIRFLAWEGACGKEGPAVELMSVLEVLDGYLVPLDENESPEGGISRES